jgi:hypothetical protein
MRISVLTASILAFAFLFGCEEKTAAPPAPQPEPEPAAPVTPEAVAAWRQTESADADRATLEHIAALASALTAETPTESWSAPKANALSDSFRLTGFAPDGLQLDCRTTLCLATVTTPTGLPSVFASAPDAVSQWLMQTEPCAFTVAPGDPAKPDIVQAYIDCRAAPAAAAPAPAGPAPAAPAPRTPPASPN